MKIKKNISGVTLIEIMATIMLITVAVIGAMGFRYYSHLDFRKAQLHIAASRIANAILEDWKGCGGKATYDPISRLSDEMDITSAADKSVGLENHVATYLVTADDADYFTTVSYRDDLDKPRLLNVTVNWSWEYSAAAAASGDPSVSVTTYSDY